MIKFDVPLNDQSVYEITTENGNKYFIRCPGMSSPEDENDDGLLAFLVEKNGERPAMIFNLHKIVSFIRRPDLPIGKNRPESMYDLMSRRLGEGAVGFLNFELD